MTETMQPAPRPTPYLNLLTLERHVCRICHSQGRITPLVTDRDLMMTRASRDPSPYRRARKAALRRHIADEHPEWIGRVRWSVK